MVQIYDTDSWKDCADKIFERFDINQSCSIYGIEEYRGRMVAKGELVIEELRRLDLKQNVQIGNNGKKSRRRKVLKDSVGGYVAHKIFRFKGFVVNDPIKGGDMKYTVWRVQ